MKNKHGFTMMELMVVIAIIGILSAVAIPNIVTWRQNRNFVSSLQNTLSIIHGAKAWAVKENAPTVVSFDLGGQTFRAFVDLSVPPNSAWDPGTDRQIEFYEIPQGVQMTNAAFGVGLADPFVTFNGRGLPNVDPGTDGFVELTSDRGVSNTVEVNMTGRIRVTG